MTGGGKEMCKDEKTGTALQLVTSWAALTFIKLHFK